MINNINNNLNVIVVAESSLLHESLIDNFAFLTNIDLLHPRNLDDLLEYNKIDILIIDSNIFDIKLPSYKIRSIINLSQHPVIDKEVKLSKPYRLADIANIFSTILENDKLFVSLSGGWIYNELESVIQKWEDSIRLTEKENRIIHFLIQAENNQCNKEELFKSVWCYSSNSETSTLETHLYKLRQKLPKDMLTIQNNSLILS